MTGANTLIKTVESQREAIDALSETVEAQRKIINTLVQDVSRLEKLHAGTIREFMNYDGEEDMELQLERNNKHIDRNHVLTNQELSAGIIILNRNTNNLALAVNQLTTVFVEHNPDLTLTSLEEMKRNSSEDSE